MIPKFRVWDKKSKIMYSANELIIQIRNDDFLIALEHSLHQIKNYVLMQSTGIKDVNGKEIYEEDVVEYEDKVLVARDINYQRLLECDKFKVVGNLYENPTLLGDA
ncbi:YopX family protein [Staphylococcus pasteuri]|uniref:YopX family protein n=1 Tax=Staphylococcus pasteuri TaxID=45972 RepID=UPI0012B8ACB7|nr:YopX family protein [Staphylococcus pasteuri]